MTNRAAVMNGLFDLSIQDRPMPTAGPHQAVVRIEAVGVCGSDTTYYTHGRIGDYVVDGPIVLGHEVAGQVVEVGPGVTGVAPGDRVAIEPGTPCRDCRECRAGRYHLCPDLEFLATPPYDGALLQYLLIDSRNLYPIPDELSYEEGALLEPLSVGLWACKRAGLAPGDDVLVTGAGPVGLVSAAAARALGAGTVTVTDVSEFRLGLARSMGFTAEPGGTHTSVDFDVLIECSGAPGVLAAGLARLRPAGRAAMVGMPKEAVSLPLSQLNPNELTIGTVNRYNNTWPLAIELVASGRVDLKPLITHHFTLDETTDALMLGRHVTDSVKAIIHPQR
ncbi:NAD(P)-dependent alcohol dehydrogenase [Dactylosporangium sp. AC04546]|uniref:NAD(P)-dependent alcohol dehydrogenase n=1 Tax=Dactylosporangium sp. AC04546 TaxID=2862460 RepID=UPI001EDFDC99|nr:NAD(P)-dependent alcohol dehydrogenase [Dactylosporangium sp. AC04546]WVK87094.1 NAD(P)-dependent alcohol dehydrogenase [Dactylosporangium sp. AC04546]